MIKKTNNMFDINLSKELQIRIQARSNTLRDIIAVAVRSFCGKKIIQKLHKNVCAKLHKNV